MTEPLTVTTVFVAITVFRVDSVVGRVRTLTEQFAAHCDDAEARPAPAGTIVTSSRASAIGVANRRADGMESRLEVRSGGVCSTLVMAHIGH